jgi:hypothetical protein
MGACRRTSDHHVFLCDERYETQTWPVKIRKTIRALPKKTFFGGYYLQTVIKNEKKVNSRCKLEELCYNETCSAGLCDQYINPVYCEAYY